MAGVLCSMVGATFAVAAAAEIIRAKKGIIANGNAQIDTAQSKFGGASALFDGVGDYLILSRDNALVSWNAQDYTVEYWIRPNTMTSLQSQPGAIAIPNAIGNMNPNGETNYWSFGPINNGSVRFYYFSGTLNSITTTGVTLTTGVWYHLAFVRNGTSIKIYVDGTERASGTIVGTPQYDPVFDFPIGQYNGVSMNAWIDEIRVSNTARYTANFTPSTTPFVNDNNTLLLIHANGTDASTFFEDDNGVRSPKGLFAVNQAQVDTAQSRFGGASALFDGTGDYIQSSVANDLQFTGNFTVELWVRLASTGAIRVPIGNRSGSPGAGIWWVEIGSDQTGYTAWQNTAGTSYYPTYSGTISTNTWTHLAVVRNGSTLTLYKDGVAGTAATGVTGTFGLTNGGIFIGGIAGSFNWNGHIDEVRISNTARYTANFTAPSAPFVNDSNTVLLVHCDGTDASTVFRDDNGSGRIQKGVQAQGDTKLLSAESKFGGASAYFDGNDRLEIFNPGDLTLGTSDFTIEGWYRFQQLKYNTVFTGHLGTTDFPHIFTDIPSSSPPNVFTFVDGTNVVKSTNSYAINTWYHIALTRQNGTLRLFVNGNLEFTLNNHTINYTGSNVLLGSNTSFGSAMPGYIDEFRISNTARYTASFTAPTAPFSNDANTLLLLHMDGTNASTVFFDDNGQVPQTP